MNKFFFAATALLALVAAPAMAKEEKQTFSHDGVTYTYTETKVGESTIIKGRANPGYPFYLVVRGDRVNGNTNGIPVSFRTPDAKGALEAVAAK